MTVRLAASLTTALELVDATELASLPEPAPSGEDVADALAAALVEFTCLRRGAEVPSWCRSAKREADPSRFALDNPPLRPLILSETPRLSPSEACSSPNGRGFSVTSFAADQLRSLLAQLSSRLEERGVKGEMSWSVGRWRWLIGGGLLQTSTLFLSRSRSSMRSPRTWRVCTGWIKGG
jgi:hypothetical protein